MLIVLLLFVLFFQDVNCVSWNASKIPANIWFTVLPPLIHKNQQLPTTRGTRFPGNIVRAVQDVLSKYEADTSGILTFNLYKRPASERTNLNRQVAVAWATWLVTRTNEPDVMAKDPDVVGGFLAAGFTNLDDNTTDLTDPVGLVNTLFPLWKPFMTNDGSNQEGTLDEQGNPLVYNLQRFGDYTGYIPENYLFGKPNDPDSYQPITWPSDKNPSNYYTGQVYVGPQWGLRPIHGVPNIAATFDGDIDGPDASLRGSRRQRRLFDTQVNEIINASANLDDVWKMKIEWFENKAALLGFVFVQMVGTVPGPYSGQIPWNELDISRFWYYVDGVGDAAIVLAWYYKRIFNAVRPVSAIRYSYSDTLFTAYAGPGNGVKSIYGRDWKPYLPTMPHPEFPSGSALICSAIAQAYKRFFQARYGSPNFPTTIFGVSSPGSSVLEPGITPKTTVSFNYTSPDAWAADCGESRLRGGVHFRQSIVDGTKLGTKLGNIVYDYLNTFMNNTATAAWNYTQRITSYPL